MLEEPVIIRQEHLLKLAPFCQALGEALSRSGLTPDQALGVWRAALTAQCTRCGIPISGEELFALSQPPGDNPSPKVRRLKLGDCACVGCESYFYLLTFRAQPPLDWPGLLAKAEAIQAELARPLAAQRWTAALAKGFLQSGLTRRAALALALLLLLLLIRHWHTGGAIPWLREPEHFRVAPAPEEPHPSPGSKDSPGDRLVTFDFSGYRRGLMICYDGDFPEMTRAYANRACAVLFWLNNRPDRGYAEVKDLARRNSMIMATACCCSADHPRAHWAAMPMALAG